MADEVPDDGEVAGEPLAGTQGLQTNNPGWPGFGSQGVILDRRPLPHGDAMKWGRAVLLGGLAACRFGGPSANSYDYMTHPDAAMDATSTSLPPPSAGDDGPPG